MLPQELEKDKNHQLFTLIVLPVWAYRFDCGENNLNGNLTTDVTVF